MPPSNNSERRFSSHVDGNGDTSTCSTHVVAAIVSARHGGRLSWDIGWSCCQCLRHGPPVNVTLIVGSSCPRARACFHLGVQALLIKIRTSQAASVVNVEAGAKLDDGHYYKIIKSVE